MRSLGDETQSNPAENKNETKGLKNNTKSTGDLNVRKMDAVAYFEQAASPQLESRGPTRSTRSSKETAIGTTRGIEFY